MHVKPEVFDLLLELIKKDDASALKFFLKWEKDRRNYLEHRASDGLTLLHHACLAGKRNVVHSLVDCGAYIEAKSSVGWTALHAAALSGNYDVVSYLVYGCAANPLAKDDMGCLPQDLTLESRITSILKLKTHEIREAIFIEKKKRELNEQIELQRRRNTFPEAKTSETQRTERAGILRVRSESNITRKVTFKESKPEIEETRSLPGDIELKVPIPSKMIEKIDVNQAKRDSGIFEDISCIPELACNVRTSV